MHFEPLPPDILDRLAEHRQVGGVPRAELEWLVEHGRLRRAEPGEYVGRKGQRVEDWDFGLEVLLSGRIRIRVDRGAGPRTVAEWEPGDVTGVLPFSRMRVLPGDAIVEGSLESVSVAREHFPALVRECPGVMAVCVHVMLDRARMFTTSDLQDEKMASLGKLSAGLAHELNNPAAAVARSGKLLVRAMDECDRAARTVAKAHLDDEQLRAIDRLRDECKATPAVVSRSPIERADREDEIAAWLDRHGADHSALEALSDSALPIDAMDRLAEHLEGSALDAALDWVAAGSVVRALASENERAGSRISALVSAMKRLTHMDRAPVPEPLDVEQGLRDTLMVLGHKARDKAVSVRIEVAPGLPRVRAIGGELDQVWMNLLDNALDAVDIGGEVVVTAKPEGRALVVRVIDDGPGIPPEDQTRVFDPFFTTKPPGQGTGLGLEVARTRVRGNRGQIEFESRPGRTEFRVSLPLLEAAAVAAGH